MLGGDVNGARTYSALLRHGVKKAWLEVPGTLPGRGLKYRNVFSVAVYGNLAVH